MALFPNLMMSMLVGLTATFYAGSQGYGILGCLLIYSASGQAAFLTLVALDRLRWWLSGAWTARLVKQEGRLPLQRRSAGQD